VSQSNIQDGTRRRVDLLAYLQLLRLPNVFTVVADVMMGFLFIHHSLEPWTSFACLLAASCSLYLAGMVLNDLFDVEVDRQQRPNRPLPSGRISLNVARNLGWSHLAIGWALTVAAAFLPDAQRHLHVEPALAGTLLTVAIVAYDTWLKQTALGPIVMGLCRFLNVLLAMSLVRPSTDWPLNWGPSHFVAASAIGLHIAGITWFARDEATISRRSTLVVGLVLMIAGWVLLVCLPLWLPKSQIQLAKPSIWYLLIPLLAAPLVRRLLVAIADPKPDLVQSAVRQGIWSLVLMDASIAALVAPWTWSIVIVLLFVPMMLLGRWIYAT
jgi:4-hydroxybenzoate polyprenyltransferase